MNLQAIRQTVGLCVLKSKLPSRFETSIGFATSHSESQFDVDNICVPAIIQFGHAIKSVTMSDFPTLQSSVSSALVATTRSASQLANEDLPFHRTLDPSLASKVDRQNARLLGLATGLLGAATATSETVRPPPSLKDLDSIEGNWRAVVDVVDSLLERADTALDEFTGAVKRLSPGAEVQVC